MPPQVIGGIMAVGVLPHYEVTEEVCQAFADFSPLESCRSPGITVVVFGGCSHCDEVVSAIEAAAPDLPLREIDLYSQEAHAAGGGGGVRPYGVRVRQ